MSNSAAEARPPLLAFRHVAVLTYDAIATICGLYAALLLPLKGELPPEMAAGARTAMPLLVLLRLTAVVAGGLHRWSFRTSGVVDVARFALFMCGASVVFAVVFQGLPLSVCTVELVLSTTLMVAFRLAPRLTEDFSDALSNSVDGVLRFVVAERPRRVVNVLVALVALLLTLPLWILIAIAIKLTSCGPVFYKQERIGLDLRSTRPLRHDPRRKNDLGGRPFMIYKFRTMAVDAEKSTGAVWCAKQDPRVTPIGRFLRHCRLDELPQLVNVLKGDMNVVGPRPERPKIFAELRTKIPNYSMRQRVRPGITGHAQVNLEYDASIDDVARKLKFDLEYLSQQGIAADLHIMVKTIPVMLFRNKVLTTKERCDAAGPVSSEKTTRVERVPGGAPSSEAEEGDSLGSDSSQAHRPFQAIPIVCSGGRQSPGT